MTLETNCLGVQRRLNIGYARAAGILDQLKEKGCVAKAVGFEPRKVLKNRQYF